MKHIYRFIISVFAVSSMSPLFAQYEWTNAGPDNIASTTRALAFDGNGNLLAGSQGGGLWISSNRGQSWAPVAGYNGNPNITSIAVDGSTIYVATGATKFTKPFPVSNLSFPGDWDYRTTGAGFTGYLTGFPGEGVFVSNDNGATWSNANATTTGVGSGTLNYTGPFTDIQKILVAGDRIFVATAEGLYYSDDKLETIEKATGGDFFENNLVFDVEVAANNRVFATAHLDASGQFDSLYISTNNGNTFSAIKSDLLTNGGTAQFSFNRAEIAVAPSDNNIVYVAATQLSGEINGVYKYNISDDRWSQVGPRGASGFTPLGGEASRNAFILEVFPDNPNELILAGSRWFTFLEGEGWSQTANPFNPTALNYVPSGITRVLFDPSDPNTLFVAARQEIRYSGDRAQTFSNRSKGYETANTYSVSALSVVAEGEETSEFSIIYAGTANAGTVINSRYKAGLPSSQSFGAISASNNGRVGASVLYPGGIIMQGTDRGLVRSINYGANVEQFYQTSIPPQVANLIPAITDTVINKQSDDDESGNLFNNPNPAQAVWAIDEQIPASVLDREDITTEELQATVGSYIYFCSRNYVWVVNGAFGDGLQVKWNRITDRLVDGLNEVFTSMTVANDANHTIYIGTSLGNVFRISGANDLKSYDALANVTQFDLAASNLRSMEDRWITDMAVDPNNPNRLVITYAGYGGNANGVPSNVWATDSATFGSPSFNSLNDTDNLIPLNRELTYSVSFVEQGDSTILLIGTETGLVHTSIKEVIFIEGVRTPIYLMNLWTKEAAIPSVPVYDIFVRKYQTRVREKALTRIVDGKEVPRDNFILSRSQEVYIATHGAGIWNSTSFALRKGREVTEVPPLSEMKISLYPNPNMGQETTVEVSLTADTEVQIEMYDLSGRRIDQQRYTNLPAGMHTMTLDARGLVSGLYLVKVRLRNETETLDRTFKSMIVH